MSSSIPPHYLANTAAALGGFILLNNVYGTFKPRGLLDMLGYPTPISASDQTLVNGVTRMFASTRVVMGITTLSMWYFKSHKALGASMIAGCIMAIADGLVSKEVSGKGEWGHWGFAPVGTAIGIGLLMGAEQ